MIFRIFYLDYSALMFSVTDEILYLTFIAIHRDYTPLSIPQYYEMCCIFIIFCVETFVLHVMCAYFSTSKFQKFSCRSALTTFSYFLSFLCFSEFQFLLISCLFGNLTPQCPHKIPILRELPSSISRAW